MILLISMSCCKAFFLPIYLPFSGTISCPGLFNLVGGLLSWVIRGSFPLIIKWLFDVTYKLVRFAPLGFTCFRLIISGIISRIFSIFRFISRSESILRWKEILRQGKIGNMLSISSSLFFSIHVYESHDKNGNCFKDKTLM